MVVLVPREACQVEHDHEMHATLVQAAERDTIAAAIRTAPVTHARVLCRSIIRATGSSPEIAEDCSPTLHASLRRGARRVNSAVYGQTAAVVLFKVTLAGLPGTILKNWAVLLCTMFPSPKKVTHLAVL